MLRLIPFFASLMLLLPAPVTALVSEGRPGVPYFNHVLFLQGKVIKDGRVVAVSLAYADPRDETDLCRNSVDVFGGLDKFKDVPLRTWVVADYELQSITVSDGFIGDADVSWLRACPDLETCLRLSEERQADPVLQQRQAQQPRAESTTGSHIETIQGQLEAGRKLVKAARCRGCHSIEGFGPGHAPSLTWKRFKYEQGWLKGYLQNPYRMRPGIGDLMMVKYTSENAQPKLSKTELDLVANYLTNAATASAPNERFRYEPWQDYECYRCHTRRYKQKPLIFEPTTIPPELAAKARNNVTLQSCLGCHPFGNLRTIAPPPPGMPNSFATDLLLAFEKLSLNYLSGFLENPSYLEPQTRMPNLWLKKSQIAEIRSLAKEIKSAIAEGDLRPTHTLYEMKKQSKQEDPIVIPE